MFGIAATYVTRKLNTPGHGYLVAEKAMLRQLGIAGVVSNCSYEGNGSVYLEEDCDAPLFITAMAREGFVVEYNEIEVDDNFAEKLSLDYYSA
jgi:hypothetical protein